VLDGSTAIGSRVVPDDSQAALLFTESAGLDEQILEFTTPTDTSGLRAQIAGNGTGVLNLRHLTLERL